MALDRLITVASDRTDGGGRVANFLLSWWDGPFGTFPITNLTDVDAEIAEDMLIIMAFLVQHGVTYASAWGREADIGRLIDLWDWKTRAS